MRALHSILVTAFLTLGFFSAISYIACNKDKCNNVACLNGGECDGGICTCAAGFEGNRCQTPSRDKWIANYNGGDSCSYDGATPYNVRLLVDPTSKTKMTLLRILNNNNDSAACTMVATDSFTFNGSNNSITYRGNGKLSNDSLWMSYHVQYDTINYDCKYFGIRY